MKARELAQQQALAPSITKALEITCTTPSDVAIGIFADRKPKPAHIRHQGARECARRLRFEAKMLQRAGEREWQETRQERALADRQRAAQWKARHG